MQVKKNIQTKCEIEETYKITQVINDFVKGIDNSDMGILDKVFHANFRVTNNRFMGTSGTRVLS